MQNERPIAAYNVGAVPRDVMRIFYEGGHGRLDEVRAWLDAGGDPNAVEYHIVGNGVQLNILSRASISGATAVARLLLERGADPNKGNGSDGAWGTALHWGAGNRWATPELIEALVAHGGDVNAAHTPAVYALLFSSRAVPQEIFGKVLSYVYFGPSSTTPPYPWDPSRDERDTEYWRTYLALEGLPVPDKLQYPDVPRGDPRELPGWVDREDESTGDY